MVGGDVAGRAAAALAEKPGYVRRARGVRKLPGWRVAARRCQPNRVREVPAGNRMHAHKAELWARMGFSRDKQRPESMGKAIRPVGMGARACGLGGKEGVNHAYHTPNHTPAKLLILLLLCMVCMVCIVIKIKS